jgi:transporter family-2 protein
MRSMYYLLAAVAGAVIPLQALINSHLGRAIGGPLWAAATSFAVGTIALIAYSLSFAPSGFLINQALATLPWWAWTGGFLGAFFVTSSIVVVSEIGTTEMVALVIMGQLVSAALLDHFGILHAAQPASLSRMMGVVLLMAGVLLITRAPA